LQKLVDEGLFSIIESVANVYTLDLKILKGSFNYFSGDNDIIFDVNWKMFKGLHVLNYFVDLFEEGPEWNEILLKSMKEITFCLVWNCMLKEKKYWKQFSNTIEEDLFFNYGRSFNSKGGSYIIVEIGFSIYEYLLKFDFLLEIDWGDSITSIMRKLIEVPEFNV